MPNITYTFSAQNVQNVTGAFQTINTAAAASAAKVKGTDAQKATSAQQSSTKRKVAAKSSAAESLKGVKLEIRGIKKLQRALKELIAAQTRRGTSAKTASEKAAASAKKEAAALKRLEVANKRAQAASNRRAMGRLRSFSGGTGLMGLGATGMMLGGMVGGAAVRSAVQLETAVAELAVKGRRPGQSANVGSLMRRVQGTALANPGVKSIDLTKGMMAYVSKTGDLPGAKRYLDTFATVGGGTGTNMEDLGRVMAEMKIKMGISDPREMMTGLSMMAVAGKRNRIELSDLAKYLPKMASSMTRFSGRTGFDAVKSLAGLIQVGAEGSGTAAGAATSMERAYANVAQAQHTGKLSALGIKAFRTGSKSKFRDFEDILADILYTTDNRLTGDAIDAQGRPIKKKNRKVALMDIFKQRGIRYVSGFSRKWDELSSGADRGGQKRTIDETRSAFMDFIQTLKQGTNSVSEIAEDHRIKQQLTGAKLTAAWEEVTLIASKTLLPVLQGFVGDPTKIQGMMLALTGMFEVFAGLGKTVGFVAEQFGFLAGEIKKSLHGNRDADKLAELTPELKENLRRQKEIRAGFKGSGWTTPELEGLTAKEKVIRGKMEEAKYGRFGHVPGITELIRDKAGKVQVGESGAPGMVQARAFGKRTLIDKLVGFGVTEEAALAIANEATTTDMPIHEAVSGKEGPYGDLIAKHIMPKTGILGGISSGFTDASFGKRGKRKQFNNLIRGYMESLANTRGRMASDPDQLGTPMGMRHGQMTYLGSEGQIVGAKFTVANANIGVPGTLVVSADTVQIKGAGGGSPAHPGQPDQPPNWVEQPL